jgi:hypothetical protein
MGEGFYHRGTMSTEKDVGIKGWQGHGSGLGVDVRFPSVSNLGC